MGPLRERALAAEAEAAAARARLEVVLPGGDAAADAEAQRKFASLDRRELEVCLLGARSEAARAQKALDEALRTAATDADEAVSRKWELHFKASLDEANAELDATRKALRAAEARAGEEAEMRRRAAQNLGEAERQAQAARDNASLEAARRGELVRLSELKLQLVEGVESPAFYVTGEDNLARVRSALAGENVGDSSRAMEAAVDAIATEVRRAELATEAMNEAVRRAAADRRAAQEAIDQRDAALHAAAQDRKSAVDALTQTGILRAQLQKLVGLQQ